MLTAWWEPLKNDPHVEKANRRCLRTNLFTLKSSRWGQTTLNSPPMVAGLRSYLFAAGVNVPHEIMKGSLVLSSDTGHLLNGRFDVDHMLSVLNEAVDQALNEGYQGLWATGDMSWEFGPEKNFSKLLEYEWRLEEYFQKQPALSGICQYHTDTLPHTTVQDGLSTHQAIFINDTLSRLNPFYVQRPATLLNYRPAVY